MPRAAGRPCPRTIEPARGRCAAALSCHAELPRRTLRAVDGDLLGLLGVLVAHGEHGASRPRPAELRRRTRRTRVPPRSARVRSCGYQSTFEMPSFADAMRRFPVPSALMTKKRPGETTSDERDVPSVRRPRRVPAVPRDETSPPAGPRGVKDTALPASSWNAGSSSHSATMWRRAAGSRAPSGRPRSLDDLQPEGAVGGQGNSVSIG